MNDRLPFHIEDITRGQTRGLTSDGKLESNSTLTGKVQFLVDINDKLDQAKTGIVQKKINPKYERFLKTSKMIARIYVLEGIGLTPHDKNTSDPYLVLKLGDQSVKDISSIRPKTNDPKFFKHYDFALDIPGSATLEV